MYGAYTIDMRSASGSGSLELDGDPRDVDARGALAGRAASRRERFDGRWLTGAGPATLFPRKTLSYHSGSGGRW